MSIEERFILQLQKYDRKAYAELRRSLGYKPGYYIPAIPYVEPFAVSEKYPRESIYLFAGLYCLANRPLEGEEPPKEQDEKPGLGASIGSLYMARDKSGSIEKRFIRLLDADREQLPNRLRQMIMLLKSNDIGINWKALLKDLFNWYKPSKKVQHKWARQFYMQEKKETNTNTSGGKK